MSELLTAPVPDAKTGIPEAMLPEHWYVAATSDEISSVPLGRTILGEPVAFYRKADGTPVALQDRCPHRGFPLSVGNVENDALVCDYHGFTFDACGTCVYVPGQTQIPRSAVVRSFPLVERAPLVWIWMGDPARADAARIPDHHWASDPSWFAFAKNEVIAARYGLLIDNLLDLSHETYVHGSTIGSRDVAETPIKAALEGAVVRVSRHMEKTVCPPFYAESTGMSTPIDRWQDIEYHVPSFYVLHVRIAPAEADDARAVFLKIMYGITPVGPRETRLFWIVARNFAIDQAPVTETLVNIQDVIVEQDKTALERLESVLPKDRVLPEISVNLDRGALLARRALLTLAKG
jgi:phenylpropionate dioxygenase-like ring-hydroxylating dioxygenase large terminal subunit